MGWDREQAELSTLYHGMSTSDSRERQLLWGNLCSRRRIKPGHNLNVSIQKMINSWL